MCFYLKNVLISFHVQLKGTVCAPVMVEYLCILIVTVDRKDNNAQMNIIYYGYLGSFFVIKISRYKKLNYITQIRVSWSVNHLTPYFYYFYSLHFMNYLIRNVIGVPFCAFSFISPTYSRLLKVGNSSLLS